MIHELPLGNLVISTDNLLYKQVVEKFVERLNEEPLRLLTILNENQTNAEPLTSLRKKIEDLEAEKMKLEDELADKE